MEKLTYMPETDREKVMIYELLDDLGRVVEKRELVLGIIPVNDPKGNVRDWIDEWHKELSKDGESG